MMTPHYGQHAHEEDAHDYRYFRTRTSYASAIKEWLAAIAKMWWNCRLPASSGLWNSMNCLWAMPMCSWGCCIRGLF